MTTYVIFDGDKDRWAYEYLRGWKANKAIDFDFEDAHDLDNMTSRAQTEEYVKGKLRERMRKASNVVVMVGESTRNLFRFVRWEIELAIDLGKPIIVANLNDKNGMDEIRCPPILREICAVHIPYKLAVIRHAITYWPSEYLGLSAESKAAGSRRYSDEKVRELVG